MPGGRPTKPLVLVKGHRTKAEKEVREKAEKKLLTGISLKEWPEVKDDPIAHKEFKRLKKVLKAIDQDNALHEAVINRYCLLHSECKGVELLKEQCNDDLKEVFEAYQKQEIDFLTYLEKKEGIQNRFLALDKKLMEKRKMMLAIEKENVMTIQSALRSIPKTPDKSAEKSPMAAFLERRQAGKNAT
ncbi:hypothetical protein BR63_19145 [Thermanaerosceptrum fracticalcis]|uniref:Uncharacterized protein n=1 Tax=Thermanaerosceptrum fracticalcis TaxID=1712410 RepID=A0A7G6E7Z4_THEFR|nr:hypothetical protein [Thermanaerosceptrum fracticalcis]QNB48198.1 hypothetical protein BR63_19145 [Thermanaerosceptrum fracticalcis]